MDFADTGCWWEDSWMLEVKIEDPIPEAIAN